MLFIPILVLLCGSEIPKNHPSLAMSRKLFASGLIGIKPWVAAHSVNTLSNRSALIAALGIGQRPCLFLVVCSDHKAEYLVIPRIPCLVIAIDWPEKE